MPSDTPKDVAKETPEVDQRPIVELRPAIDDIDGEVKAYDAAGALMPVPARIVITPFFYGSQDSPTIAYTKIMSGPGVDAKDAVRAVVRLNGRSGRLGVSDRTKSSSPAFLREPGEDDEDEQDEEQDEDQGDEAGAEPDV